MKSKSGNYKLIYQNLKKRREKNKSNSLKGSEDMNDDSLDYKQKSQTKINRLITNNNEQINEQDLRQLRTCISNQFKKSNYINFSTIKIKSTAPNVQSEKYNFKQREENQDNTRNQEKNVLSHFHKKKLLSSHNRSQSCPFIEPLCISDNFSTKDAKNNDPGIVFSSIKIQKQQKKKISMQHLSRNRNKFNGGGSGQKKNLNHNYSNSLTQSSNTVIVHNIPNQIHQSIVPNQNLSSILYRKEQDEQTITKKSVRKSDKQKNCLIVKGFTQIGKVSGVSEKTLLKKSLVQKESRNDLLIKTRLQQRMVKYQIKEEKLKLQNEYEAVILKNEIIEKLLKKQNVESFNDIQLKSQTSDRQSIILDQR